jgi:hypothetical protein
METEILSSIISYLKINYKGLNNLVYGKQNEGLNINLKKSREFHLGNLNEIARLSNNRELIQLKCKRQLRQLEPRNEGFNLGFPLLSSLCLLSLETLTNLNEDYLLILDSVVPYIDELSSVCIISLIKMFFQPGVSNLSKGIIIKLLSYQKGIGGFKRLGYLALQCSDTIVRYYTSLYYFRLSQSNPGMITEVELVRLSQGLTEDQAIYSYNVLRCINNCVSSSCEASNAQAIIDNLFNYFETSSDTELIELSYAIFYRMELSNLLTSEHHVYLSQSLMSIPRYTNTSLKLIELLVAKQPNLNRPLLANFDKYFLTESSDIENSIGIFIQAIKKGYGVSDEVVLKISKQLKQANTTGVYQNAMQALKLLVENCIPLKLAAEKELKYTVRNKNLQYEVAQIILEMNNKLIPWYKK